MANNKSLAVGYRDLDVYYQTENKLVMDIRILEAVMYDYGK